MDSKLQSKSMEFLQSAVKGAMEDYELRAPQLEMMNACAKIIESGGASSQKQAQGPERPSPISYPLYFPAKRRSSQQRR